MKPVNRFILRCLPLIIACQISVEPLSGSMFSSRSFHKIIIFPEQVDLHGSQSQQQFLVTGIDSAGNEIDLTHLAEWTASQPDIVKLDQGGVASPKGNGSTDITARWKGLTATAVVSVLAASFLFSMSHYIGTMADSWQLYSFMFRWAAGLLFTVLYFMRGFAITAYTHALYDIWVLV